MDQLTQLVSSINGILWGVYCLIPLLVGAGIYFTFKLRFVQIRKFCVAAKATFGDLSLQPVAAPGHTPGSTCLVCGNVVFAGDTLFAGSVGRTDLPGGDSAALCATLVRLMQVLSPELQILPGHGEFSTVAQEKLSNPYVRYALRNPQGSF
jgi:glyoxylase-like metal-dependent hydrolase (beta-lactamase superfamily II)